MSQKDVINKSGQMKQISQYSVKVIIILFFIIQLFLVFTNLGNTYLWDDEAEVAIGGKNFLSTGHCTAWDGRNLFSYRNGTLVDRNLYLKNPPLSYLLTALSFKIFPVSTWSARFLFAIAGIMAMLIFILIIKEYFSKDVILAIYIITGFSLSTVFLLNIRQCRYYALSLLFSLLTFYIYILCIKRQKTVYFLLFSLTSALLFYSHFFVAIAFLLGLSVIHIIFNFYKIKEWHKIILAITCFIAATLPYGLYYEIWNRPDLPVTHRSLFIHRPTLLWWNIRELNLINCMPWTIIICLLYILIKYRNDCTIKAAWQWFILGFANLFFIALLSRQNTDVNSIAEIRYLITTIPALYVLTGIFFRFVHNKNKFIAITLFILFITTNLLTWNPLKWQFRWLFPAYVYEITHDYPTAHREVVKFLDKNTQQDETIMAIPEYMNYPLMFYRGDKLKFACLLDGNTPLPVEKIEKLNIPVMRDKNFPQWLISFGLKRDTEEFLIYLSRIHTEKGILVRYEYKLIDILDIYWEQTNRPELPWHSFGPMKYFNKEMNGIYIFRGHKKLIPQDSTAVKSGKISL